MGQFKWILDKLAVEHEQGLTNAQMMLTNSDLRPGETHHSRISDPPFIVVHKECKTNLWKQYSGP